MPASEFVLLLGGDLGDPVEQLALAEIAIAARVGSVQARSRDHWTAAWGFTSGTLFLNRALLVRTQLEPHSVMDACLAIERSMGRVRSESQGMASRPIDIDILAIGDRVIMDDTLTVPHPRLHLRRFALAPLCDILPRWRHPILDREALDLLNALPPQ
ncbi:MAG: 2-amino-4-hydroxy-6-hydroxymethyldihydropteridine diphosphokinase [Flavobacteriales bacterium]|nr:2-amino-4-hydroxy-6-hydroxymethyldihydropteridine diphosphokinase [Flavobacteriales bacterium]